MQFKGDQMEMVELSPASRGSHPTPKAGAKVTPKQAFFLLSWTILMRHC